MSAKKRGLGRGLDALLGGVRASDVTGSAPLERDKLRSLPIELMQSGRFQPRKDFDKDRLQELADSISAQGVVQPIVVRAIADQRYEIIAGERRWRAAQMAGLQEIPVVVREVSDQAALAIALIENIQREDLNPLEEADAMKRLQEEFTMTHQQIADAVGKSRATVTNFLRLHELHPDVKALLQQRRLEMGHARAILALPLEKQSEAGNMVAERKLSVRETESLVRRLQLEKRAISPIRDPDITRLESEVMEKLGAKVNIQHTKQGAGKLVISYDSLDQLQGVLDRLG
jgi:ParB family chromosome partitioning protein